MRIERTFTFDQVAHADGELEIDNVVMRTTYARTFWERLRWRRPRTDGPIELSVDTAQGTVTVRYVDDQANA